MVDILTAVLTDGLPAVEAACAEAIAQGVHSADVVLNILSRQRAGRDRQSGHVATAPAVGKTIAIRLGLVQRTTDGEQPRIALRRLHEPENSDV